MVVLDQDGVIQAETVIQAPAAAHGVLFQMAQARRRLAGVGDPRLRSADRGRIGVGQGGDARQPTQQVQRRPLGRKQGAGVGFDLGQYIAGLDQIAVGHAFLEARAGVERQHREPRAGQARHDAGLARGEHRRKPGVGPDTGLGRYVAGAAQVFGQGGRDHGRDQ